MELCTCCLIACTLIFVALFSRQLVPWLLKIRPLWMGGLAGVANVSKNIIPPSIYLKYISYPCGGPCKFVSGACLYDAVARVNGS